VSLFILIQGSVATDTPVMLATKTKTVYVPGIVENVIDAVALPSVVVAIGS
jgi:hypothetical protein